MEIYMFFWKQITNTEEVVGPANQRKGYQAFI